MHLLGDVRGKTVLVTGAASSVGHYAAQIASEGRDASSAPSAPERGRHARDAGISQSIDYKTEPVAQRVKEMTGGRGADAIIDMDFSSTRRSWAEGALRHGTIACYGSNQMDAIPIPFRQFLMPRSTCAFSWSMTCCRSSGKPWRKSASLLEQGRLQHAIGARYPLHQIVAAHEAVEGGMVMGDVVVDIAWSAGTG